MKRYFGVWVFVTVLWQSSYAAETDCDRFPEVAKTGLKGCDCSNELDSKYQLSDDSGHRLVLDNPDMKLVAVCDYRMEYGDPYGYYFFRGKLRTSGIVERKEYVAWGEGITFNGQVYGALLPNGLKSIKKLKVPEISRANRCWSADATLTITQYVQCIGEGDACTNNILEFDVEKIGKYEKCGKE